MEQTSVNKLSKRTDFFDETALRVIVCDIPTILSQEMN